MRRLRLLDGIIERGISPPRYEWLLPPWAVADEGRVARSIWAEEGDWRSLPDTQIVRLAAMADPSFPIAVPEALLPMYGNRARTRIRQLDRMSDTELGTLRCRALLPELEPSWTVTPREVLESPVVVADNVAEYFRRLKPETPTSVISRILPPHPRTFVEMQLDLPLREPGIEDRVCAGVLFELIDEAQAVDLFPVRPTWEARPHFYLRARTVWQVSDGPIVGAVWDALMGLGRDGRMMVGRDGQTTGLRGISGLGPEAVPRSVETNIERLGGSFLVPALLTLSLMHCKNVTVAEQARPRPDSRRSRRTEGPNPYERYSVVEVGAMRRVLEREGQIGEKGLAHALQFVRAHYKTYTPERPLLGRVSGEFFWDEHVRGDPEVGVIAKDYKVSESAPLGMDIDGP